MTTPIVFVAPIVVLAALSVTALLIGAFNHGKAQPPESFWSVVFTEALMWGLLAWAFGWWTR